MEGNWGMGQLAGPECGLTAYGSPPERCVLGDTRAGHAAARAMRDAPARDVRHQLKRLVSRMTADVHLREDLIQEALLHLWRLQQEEPGRPDGWYLQSCRFHLHNLLRKGRSVDAWKRRRARLSEFEAVEWMDKQWSADPAND